MISVAEQQIADIDALHELMESVENRNIVALYSMIVQEAHFHGRAGRTAQQVIHDIAVEERAFQ